MSALGVASAMSGALLRSRGCSWRLVAGSRCCPSRRGDGRSREGLCSQRGHSSCSGRGASRRYTGTRVRRRRGSRWSLSRAGPSCASPDQPMDVCRSVGACVSVSEYNRTGMGESLTEAEAQALRRAAEAMRSCAADLPAESVVGQLLSAEATRLLVAVDQQARPTPLPRSQPRRRAEDRVSR